VRATRTRQKADAAYSYFAAGLLSLLDMPMDELMQELPLTRER
jgi:hypothetical protein